VPKDLSQATRLMGQASVAGNFDAMVEFAIAQFNGEGTAKNEAAAARLFLIAARLGSAIAQNRLARILMAGRGVPADPTEAVKWHIVAKAGGASDPELDVFAGKQKPEVRDAAQKAASKWLSTVAAQRP
jgi:TPR repeat protein